MEKTVNKHFGIDLGTTNSVISYAILNSKEQCETKIADVVVPNGNNNLSPEKIIPSVVEYPDNFNADLAVVGPKAKNSHTYRVVRSVKSLMGKKEFLENGNVISDKTPAQVSARILKCLTQKCKIKGDMTDVVVAVPASFPPAAMNATKEAMQLAGINITGDHPVIISEPLAVMYSIWEKKILGDIDDDVISFDKDQNILVFDIGGGTTDVAIFSLKKNDNILEMFKNSQQIACSGHTPFAGDDFDMAIAEKMYKNAIEANGVNPKYPHIVKATLKEYAEQIKKQYSDAVYNGLLSDDVEFSVSIENLYEGYRYYDTFYMEDIEELSEPFLARHLTLLDALRANELPEEDMQKNIIYPILECINKAYKKMGSDFKITSVVLNGGMTYFPLIKGRLDELFGMECITTLNGDLSVAQGAAFFHYCMHAYGAGNVSLEEIVPREILNSTLSFGLEGSYISPFAEAGKNLPFSTGLISDRYYMSCKSDKIKVDIYSGEGSFKNLPCQIAYRKVFNLGKSYPEGTAISFQAEVDSLKQLKLKMYINNCYHTEYLLETKSCGNIEKDDKTAAKICSEAPINILPLNDINIIADLRNMKKKNKKQKISVAERCNEISERICRATNKKEVCAAVVRKLNGIADMDDTLVGDLYKIAIKLFESFSDEDRSFVISHAKKQFGKLSNYNRYVKELAVDIIYKFADDGNEFVANLKSDVRFSEYTQKY